MNYMKAFNNVRRFALTVHAFIFRNRADYDFMELLKGSSIAFVFRIAGSLMGYVFTLLIARNRGADGMGVFTLCISMVNILTVFGMLGCNTALLRFAASYSSINRYDLIRKMYFNALILVIPFSLLLAVLMFCFSGGIATFFFHKPDLKYYLKIASLSIVPIVLMQINAESLRGLKKIKEYSFLMSLATNLSAAAILVILLMYRNSESMPLFAYLMASFFVCGISAVLWRRSMDFDHSGQEGTITLRTLLKVALPMLTTSSMGLVMSWTGVLMLGILSTKSDVGIYNVAIRIAAANSLIIAAINTISAPKFAELYERNDMEKLGHVVNQAIRMIFWLSVPIFLIILTFPKFLLGLFGASFEEGVYALLLLTLGQLINALTGPVGILLNMTNFQEIVQRTALIAVAVNVGLNYSLVPRYGILGAATATAASGIVWNLLCVFFVKLKMNIWTLYFPGVKIK